MSKALVINVDGACKGNPGAAGIGVVIRDNDKIIKEISKSIGQATNNIAEYTAIIFALQEAVDLKADKVQVFTDSELAFHQINGTYKVKDQKLRVLFDQVKSLIRNFDKFEITHVLRQYNKEADQLASSACIKS